MTVTRGSRDQSACSSAPRWQTACGSWRSPDKSSRATRKPPSSSSHPLAAHRLPALAESKNFIFKLERFFTHWKPNHLLFFLQPPKVGASYHTGSKVLASENKGPCAIFCGGEQANGRSWDQLIKKCKKIVAATALVHVHSSGPIGLS